MSRPGTLRLLTALAVLAGPASAQPTQPGAGTAITLRADRHEISIKSGGTQRLTINAGRRHANRSYWIFGSVTGTSPGIEVLGARVPLNPDPYTRVARAAVDTGLFSNFRGRLDASGSATASLNLPANLPVSPGFTLHHACVVYGPDAAGFAVSNAVPLALTLPWKSRLAAFLAALLALVVLVVVTRRADCAR